MTSTSARPEAPRRPTARDIPRLAERLASRFGLGSRVEDTFANQHLLDALDRGDLQRFVVWPPRDATGVLYNAPGGSLLVAGLEEAGPALAEAAEDTGWRVLLGDWELSSALLDKAPRRLLRRRPNVREQRLMVATVVPAGYGDVLRRLEGRVRRGTAEDVGALTDFACRLHVEDQMGPPIPRSGRGPVRARMLESLGRGNTWVIEGDGAVIGKVDVSLHTSRRGGQVAGVYVDQEWRGRGLGGAAVAAVTDRLLTEGLTGVTLHVRAGNTSAIAAYRRAGYNDRGPLLLALR